MVFQPAILVYQTIGPLWASNKAIFSRQEWFRDSTPEDPEFSGCPREEVEGAMGIAKVFDGRGSTFHAIFVDKNLPPAMCWTILDSLVKMSFESPNQKKMSVQKTIKADEASKFRPCTFWFEHDFIPHF